MDHTHWLGDHKWNGLRHGHNTAMAVSTHEVNLAPHFVDTVYLVARGGRLVMRGTPADILGKPELLQAHHLEPPVLVALFRELKGRGIALDTALTVKEAADKLVAWVGRLRPRQ